VKKYKSFDGSGRLLLPTTEKYPKEEKNQTGKVRWDGSEAQ
jgi:hypothetical protein